MQRSGRLPGAALADQQKSATAVADACGVQRHQRLGTRREREHRKLDELIAGVVRESEHVSRHHDKRRSVLGGQDCKVRGARGSAQQSRPGKHLDPRWISLRPRAVARCERQSDAKARCNCGELVPRQTTVSPIYEALQLGAAALKLKLAAEQTHACARRGSLPLLKRVSRYVSGAGFPAAHLKP